MSLSLRGSRMRGSCKLSLLFSLFSCGAIRARSRLRARDGDRTVVDSRRVITGVVRERVLEVVRVVALLESIEPLVRAARLLPVERRIRHCLRNIEQITQLDREQPFGIPDPGSIVDVH